MGETSVSTADLSPELIRIIHYSLSLSSCLFRLCFESLRRAQTATVQRGNRLAEL